MGEKLFVFALSLLDTVVGVRILHFFSCLDNLLLLLVLLSALVVFELIFQEPSVVPSHLLLHVLYLFLVCFVLLEIS